VPPRKIERRRRIKEISESEREIDSSVTCLIESELTDGMRGKSMPAIIIPLKTLSRRMPLKVAKNICNIF
jgi:hypothetical protein